MKELTYEITNMCSLKCLHCSTEADEHGDIFVTPEEVKETLKRYPDFPLVRLSGGEPFEHPKLVEIVRIIERQLKILSNGIKDKQPVPYETMEVVAPYIDEIIFSYYGMCGHDYNVEPIEYPRPYWEMLMETVKDTKKAQIPFSFETVVMWGVDLLDIAMQLDFIAKGKPLNWHLLRFVKQGRGKTNEEKAIPDDYAAYIPTMVKGFRQEFRNLNITYSNSFERNACDCGSEKAVVTCYGEHIPCSALKYSSRTGKFACSDRL